MFMVVAGVFALSLNANAQLLINEVENDPPNQQNEDCQYVELRGTPGATVPANTWFVSINSDNDNPGFLTAALNISGRVVGSNGTITLDNTFANPCPNRTYPAGTTLIEYFSPITIGGSNLTTGSENFVILQTTQNLFPGLDIDPNDDGEIAFPVTYIDAVSYIVNPEENFVYPANSPVVNAATPFTDVPDALVRFPNNNTPFSAAAYYFGELANSPDETVEFVDPRSPNFPAGGVLTPGAPNAPSVVVAPPTLFDFNGDRRADQGVFRNGNWLLNLSNGNQFRSVQWGQAGDTIAPADYDGDGTTDIAVYRAETLENVFYILRSQNNTVQTERFGRAGDIPVSGQWDADALADVAVYRPATTAGGQSFFFYNSSSVPGVDVVGIPWGTAGDVPVAADYDGDNRYDAAVYRGGTWLARLSSNGQLFSLPFGTASDIPVPADYNGDNRVDQAVFRNGVWFANLSPNNTFFTVPFGQAGDIPVPADYDGDNVDDQAVFRNGQWFARLSQGGGTFFALPFGQTGDEPIPAAYIP
jgi:hypothetical protein